MQDFFPPFFPVLFHRGFRLLPAKIQCLKQPFRPPGEILQPPRGAVLCCACAAWGDHGVAAVMPLAGGDTTSLRGRGWVCTSITSGHFVKTPSTVQIVTAPKACIIKISWAKMEIDTCRRFFFFSFLDIKIWKEGEVSQDTQILSERFLYISPCGCSW